MAEFRFVNEKPNLYKFQFSDETAVGQIKEATADLMFRIPRDWVWGHM
jgi:hypothetical protein